jgi:hypothetical protein
MMTTNGPGNDPFTLLTVTLAVAAVVTVAGSPREDVATHDPFAGLHEPSPLAVAGPYPEGDEDELSKCVDLTLDMGTRHTHRLQGTVRIKNNCGTAIAVLTEPLEIRTRAPGEEPFVNERTLPAVYAILYVFAKEDGRNGLHRAADGFQLVHGWPRYVAVDAEGGVDLTLDCDLSKHNLPPGEYGVFLQTLVAPLGASEAHEARVVRAVSVAEHNQRNPGEPRVYKQPQAEWVDSSGRFVYIGPDELKPTTESKRP